MKRRHEAPDLDHADRPPACVAQRLGDVVQPLPGDEQARQRVRGVVAVGPLQHVARVGARGELGDVGRGAERSAAGVEDLQEERVDAGLVEAVVGLVPVVGVGVERAVRADDGALDGAGFEAQHLPRGVRGPHGDAGPRGDAGRGERERQRHAEVQQQAAAERRALSHRRPARSREPRAGAPRCPGALPAGASSADT